VGQKVDLGWDEAQSLVLIDDGFDVAEEQDRHFVQA
jgi:hypothetical protein